MEASLTFQQTRKADDFCCDCRFKGYSSDFIAGWRDIDQTMPRSEGKLKILEELFTQVKQLRPADASVIKGLYYTVNLV